MRLGTLLLLVVSTLTACPAPAPPSCSEPDGAPCSDASLPDATPGQPRPNEPDDAGHPWPDPARPDGGPSECSSEDAEAWARFRRSPRLTELLARCSVAPLCEGAPCTFPACVRAAARVTGCAACTNAELACISDVCGASCAANTPSENCRWCLCNSGCVNLFEACSRSVDGSCDACTAANESCPPHSLSPAAVLVLTAP
ncbi:MAG: hypothetical protein CMN30_00995 [Sandaracinus sp.]|nr:hypothetical protein [Sandaracinus sp.]